MADEDLGSLGINKQHTVRTMTNQNNRGSSGVNSRLAGSKRESPNAANPYEDGSHRTTLF